MSVGRGHLCGEILLYNRSVGVFSMCYVAFLIVCARWVQPPVQGELVDVACIEYKPRDEGLTATFLAEAACTREVWCTRGGRQEWRYRR